MTIQNPRLRLRNALTIYKEYGITMLADGAPALGMESAFAGHLAISANLWSQIKGGRSIGNKLARQIESKGKKPAGWLDMEHESTAPDPTEERFIAACREAWRKADRAGRSTLKQRLILG
jgi:hypothetical protein